MAVKTGRPPVEKRQLDVRKGGRAVRLKLFDELERDLGSNIIGKRNAVLCPLCLNKFGRSAAEDGLLTEEHVIPESTGNREVTLTCKPCNSTLGYEVDVHLGRKVRLDRTFKGGEPLKGKLQWDGGGSPVDMSIKDDGSMHLHLKPTSDYMAGKLAERFGEYESGTRELCLRFVHRLSSLKYAAALVKAAYLGLFVDRGYSYILLPSLESVRKAIKGDAANRERLFDVVLPCTIVGFTEIPQPPDRITFETHSLGGVPVCVSYVNLRNSSGGAFVILPPGTSVNTGSWNGLARAAEALKQRPTFDVDMKSGGKMTLKLDLTGEAG